MKHIKRFNEELNSSTYKRAASALSTLKHTKRANKLEKHSNIMRELNKLNKLVKDLKKYTPYGIFDAGSSEGSKLKEQFALVMWYDDWSFDEWSFDDSFNYYKNKYNDTFCIRVSTGFLPILEQGEEERIKDYYSQMSGDVHTDNFIEKLQDMEDTTIGRICSYFGEDFCSTFNGPSIYVNMLIENNKIVIKSINIDEYGENVFDILGRKSGIQFKNLLIKLFSNETFDYPTYNDKNLQQIIKHELCEKTEFSKKYQFTLSEIGEFIKKESINKFYDTFNFVN